MIRGLAVGTFLAGLGGLALGLLRPRRAAFEVQKRAHIENFEQHAHDAMTHGHEHTHVTHNRRQGANKMMGEWEHLTSMHQHEHNHPALEHSHLPHENAEHEHLGEAHIHDHEHPVRS